MADIIHSDIGTHLSDWSFYRVDSLFDMQQGKSVSKAHRKGNNHKPFLRTKNIFWGNIEFAELDHMHFTSAEEIRLKLKAGDLLLCEGGDVGRTAIWNDQMEGCYYQNHLHRLRAKATDDIDPQFALYWFWYAFGVANVYIGTSNVTTIPNLSQSKLGELLLPKPEITEQRRIAHVLATLQTAIEQQARQIALTRELKSALMHKLFTEGRGEKQKETEIELVPESWDVVALGDVIDLFNGYAFKSNEKVSSSNTQLVRMGNLYQNKLDLSRTPIFYPDDFAIKHRRYLLKDGDLIMSLTGTTGKEDYGFTVEVKSGSKSLLLNQRVTRIDIVSERLTRDFVLYFLLSRRFLDQLYPTAKGMKQANLSTHVMKKLKILVPSQDEQKEISNYFRTLDNKLELAEQKKEHLEELFRTLLYQLMTGQIRVNDIELPGLS